MVVIEGIIIGGIVAHLGGGIQLLRTVSRLSAIVENGLTDDLQYLATDVRAMAREQGRAREEQARQGARIDSLYEKWGSG